MIGGSLVVEEVHWLGHLHHMGTLGMKGMGTILDGYRWTGSLEDVTRSRLLTVGGKVGSDEQHWELPVAEEQLYGVVLGGLGWQLVAD